MKRKISIFLMLILCLFCLSSCGKGTTDVNNETGGNTDTGGNTETGGNTDTGGNTETGGNTDTGGNTETGGNTDTGGNTETGGNTDTGGNTETGGNTDTGGNTETGGNTDTGGNTETGGNQTNINNGSVTGALDSGNGEVISKGEVLITSCSGLNESGYVEFSKISNATKYYVYIQSENSSEYVKLDERNCYIQELSSGKIRADLMGLKAGEYNVKIVPILSDSYEATNQASICKLGVVAYDRSGYAHFNYTSGIGAYNDDGTLKDNAIVIYVTDENKDYIMGEIEQLQDYMFNIPNYFSNSWGNKKAVGIGWWLNNAQYTKCEKNSSGVAQEAKSSNTYTPDGQSLGFYSVDCPIVIRFVGIVTTPEGCTAYDSLAEGGSEDDNGHMARMKDLNNITLEGVGFDATIQGWGLHFMCSDRTGVRGKSFEARNLTFNEYPEDALGMEGVQESNSIVASVERCWVHHCTFLPGYCANPAESDKSEGDGSCDFKRGQYFTMSYCYYEYCHKTNLVGSSDSSFQYNISFHHNIWYNCGSRIPLLRRANLHFYNNYVYCDINDDKAELSYIHSLRADCYLYSENNYYEGCKQISDGKDAGVAKLYGNVTLSCFSSNISSYIATSRTQSVSSSCSYNGIDYTNFDTNSSLFYYNDSTKQSDCYLTTAVVAREECLKYAGSYYRTQCNMTSRSTSINSNLYTVEDSIDLSSGAYTATLSSDQGILYTNVKNSKFKNQGVTFKLSDYAIITLSMTGGSSSADAAGYVVSQYGDVKLAGSGSVILEPGLYYIVSCSFDKETTISELSFEKYDSTEYNEQRIEEYNSRVNAIPDTIVYTNDCYDTIKLAMDYYSTLSAELKEQVDYTKVESAYNTYISLGKVYVEDLIDAIGTVTQDSGISISTARNAYEALLSISANIEISNYSVLVAAEETFENYAVESCIAKINAIGTVTLDSKSLIDIANNEYNALSSEQKEQVINYSVLVAAIEKYESLAAVASVEDALESVDLTSLSSMKSVLDAYNALTSSEQELIVDISKVSEVKVSYLIALIDSIGTVSNSSGEIIIEAEELYVTLSSDEQLQITNYSILEDARNEYDSILSQTQEKTFDEGVQDSTGFFTISGNLKSGIAAKEYNGKTYTTALKIESKTSITFTTAKEVVLIIVSDSASKDILVDGANYTADSNGIITVTLAQGDHSIAKDDSMNVYALIVQ